MEVFTQNFPPGISHLHTNGCFTTAGPLLIWGKKWKEKHHSRLPSAPGTYWFSACQSPGLRLWSSCWAGRAGGARVAAGRGNGAGLAGKPGLAVSNKPLKPNLLFPFPSSGFTGFIGNSPWAGEPLTPGATPTLPSDQFSVVIITTRGPDSQFHFLGSSFSIHPETFIYSFL